MDYKEGEYPRKEEMKFDRTEKLRKVLRDYDDHHVYLTDDFLAKMHKKIMSKVAEAEMAPSTPLNKVKSYVEVRIRHILNSVD